jgi:hypothetical protein
MVALFYEARELAIIMKPLFLNELTRGIHLDATSLLQLKVVL